MVWNGAQGRDRTTDTTIFNRMLYQLSYLGFHKREGPTRPANDWSAAYGAGEKALQPPSYSLSSKSVGAAGPGSA